MDDKKISDIKLDSMTYYTEEYSVYSFNFNFSDKVDPNKLVSIKFEDKDKNEYKIIFKNYESTGEKSVTCFGSLKYRAGNYKIIYIQYEKEIIKPSIDLYFIIREDILDIIKTECTFNSEICAGRLNTLTIYFNDIIIGKYLSKIIFKNVKTNKIYEPPFECINNPNIRSLDIELIFYFYGMPPGKYYIDFVYKRRLTKTKFIQEIKHCKPFEYSEIYEN